MPVKRPASFQQINLCISRPICQNRSGIIPAVTSTKQTSKYILRSLISWKVHTIIKSSCFKNRNQTNTLLIYTFTPINYAITVVRLESWDASQISLIANWLQHHRYLLLQSHSRYVCPPLLKDYWVLRLSRYYGYFCGRLLQPLLRFMCAFRKHVQSFVMSWRSHHIHSDRNYNITSIAYFS